MEFVCLFVGSIFGVEESHLYPPERGSGFPRYMYAYLDGATAQKTLVFVRSHCRDNPKPEHSVGTCGVSRAWRTWAPSRVDILYTVYLAGLERERVREEGGGGG
jgi:hypothetical protein